MNHLLTTDKHWPLLEVLPNRKRQTDVPEEKHGSVPRSLPKSLNEVRQDQTGGSAVKRRRQPPEPRHGST